MSHLIDHRKSCTENYLEHLTEINCLYYRIQTSLNTLYPELTTNMK